MMIGKTTKEIINNYGKLIIKNSDVYIEYIEDGVVWFRADELQKILFVNIDTLKYNVKNKEYKNGYNHAIEDVIGTLIKLGLCNSQEQKKSSPVHITKKEFNAILNCIVDVPENKEFEESFPVQNPKKCTCSNPEWKTSNMLPYVCLRCGGEL